MTFSGQYLQAATILTMAGFLFGCARTAPSSGATNIVTAGATFLVNAHGKTIDSVTGLRHKGYCSVLRIQSVR